MITQILGWKGIYDYIWVRSSYFLNADCKIILPYRHRNKDHWENNLFQISSWFDLPLDMRSHACVFCYFLFVYSNLLLSNNNIKLLINIAYLWIAEQIEECLWVQPWALHSLVSHSSFSQILSVTIPFCSSFSFGIHLFICCTVWDPAQEKCCPSFGSKAWILLN